MNIPLRPEGGCIKMNVDQLIGEATEYDKKLSLEVKKPKVGAKV